METDFESTERRNLSLIRKLGAPASTGENLTVPNCLKRNLSVTWEASEIVKKVKKIRKKQQKPKRNLSVT